MPQSTVGVRNTRMWLTMIGFIIVVCLVGGLIGTSSLPDAWYSALRKAPWNPPNWVFGPVWLLLYIAIAIAGARTYLAGVTRPVMGLWVTQMILNWLWSPVWFRLHAPWPAFAIIVALFAVIVTFVAVTWRSDRTSAWLFLPYGLWVAFASTLNLAIAVLN